MAGMLDDIAYLSEEIGPRPAGTEEEQQAALYVADELQKSAGFSTTIEDFACSTNPDMVRLICFGTAFVATLISLVFPVVQIAGVILTLAAAVVYMLELLGISVISRFTKSGVSQNVVAKYAPHQDNDLKLRKVILVANYDSGKESRETQGVIGRYLALIRRITTGALVAAFVLLFVKTVFFASDTAVASIVLTVLLVICLILMALPLISCILRKTSQYNCAANNNAAGIGVLLETARTIGAGLVSEEEMARQAEEDGVVLEGEEAVRAAGVAPDGATISYAAQQREMSPEESLAAAKAAIAALTGKPIVDTVPVRDVANNLVKGDGFGAQNEDVDFGFEVTDVHEPAPRVQFDDEPYDEALYSESEWSDEEEPAFQMGDESFDAGAAADGSSRIAEERVDHDVRSEQAPADDSTHAPAPVDGDQQRFNQGEALDSGAMEEQAPVTDGDHSATAAQTSEDSSIPAWARAAQQKARANKPETAPPSRSQRSRYADTPAARLTEERIEGARNQTMPGSSAGTVEAVEFRSRWSEFVNGSEESQSGSEALNERLADLHASIRATEAPHLHHDQTAVEVEETGTEGDLKAPLSEGQALGNQESAGQSDAEAALDSLGQSPTASQGAGDTGSSHARGRRSHSRSQGESADVSQATQTLAGRFQSISKRIKHSQEKQADQQGQEHESLLDRALDKVDDAAEDAARTSFMRPIDVSSLIERSDEGDADIAADYFTVSQHEEPTQGQRVEVEAAFSDAETNSVAQESFTFEASSAVPSADYEQDAYADDAVEFDAGSDQGLDGMQDEAFVEGENEEAVYEQDDDALFEPVTFNEPIENSWSNDAFFTGSYADSFQNQPAYDEAEWSDVDADGYEVDPVAQTHEPVSVSQGAEFPQPEVIDPDSSPVAPIAGMEHLISSIPAANVVSRETNADVPARQVIVLPEVQAHRSQSSEQTKQRAPMAVTNESTRGGSQALLSNMIPKIDAEIEAKPQADEPHDRFGLDLPPLTPGDVSSNASVSSTGSFATVGNTGPFAPVTDDLVADLAPDERYVEDADDSSFEEEFTESGAFAGPGYVDMPTSRMGGFFSKLRGKKSKKAKQEESSMREWIDVDEDFTAQEAGKARGSWQSFQQQDGSQSNAAAATPSSAAGSSNASTKQPSSNQGGFVDVDYSDEGYDNGFPGGKGWNGGGFSLSSLKNLRGKKEDEAPDGYDYSIEAEEVGPVMVREPENASLAVEAQERTAQINREMKRIQSFRHPEIDTEVWFVALGAELCGNSGMEAFIAEHKDELKGSIIINLEALGAGKLTYIDHEGLLKPMKPSARMKRFLRGASQRSGVSFSTDSMCSRSTPAYVAFQHGLQSMTIAGMKDGQPAYLGAMDDTIDVIEEDTLKRNAAFVLGLLKSI